MFIIEEKAISAKALEKEIRHYADSLHCRGETEMAHGCLKSLYMLEQAPALNSLENAKRAYWVWQDGHWKCSRCGCIRSSPDLALGLDAEFCGRCGAKMDF